jgi:hypothetical protein
LSEVLGASPTPTRTTFTNPTTTPDAHFGHPISGVNIMASTFIVRDQAHSLFGKRVRAADGSREKYPNLAKTTDIMRPHFANTIAKGKWVVSKMRGYGQDRPTTTNGIVGKPNGKTARRRLAAAS